LGQRTLTCIAGLVGGGEVEDKTVRELGTAMVVYWFNTTIHPLQKICSLFSKKMVVLTELRAVSSPLVL